MVDIRVRSSVTIFNFSSWKTNIHLRKSEAQKYIHRSVVEEEDPVFFLFLDCQK